MKPGRLIDCALLAGILLMSVAMIYFGVQLNRSRRPAPPQINIAAGATVPALSAIGLDGGAARVAYEGNGSPTVLYVFSPTCVWCKRNLPNLKAMMRADRQQFRWVGLSTTRTGVSEYLAKTGLHFDRVLVDPDGATAAAYGIGATPDTFVIGKGGRVLAHWRGAYAGDPVRASVEKLFSMKLPQWPKLAE